MSTAEPLGEDQWPATGVDLETRRRRILATLTALGRPGDVEQFQRALAAATRAAADGQDYAGLEGVVQGWYLHVLALRPCPVGRTAARPCAASRPPWSLGTPGRLRTCWLTWICLGRGDRTLPGQHRGDPRFGCLAA
jgi:hypothetical protein